MSSCVDSFARSLAAASLDKVDNLPTAFKVRASVATVADLPATGNEAGDVRQVRETGDEYYWDGSTWEKFGPNNAVQYVAQSLTEAQKSQARANIGAGEDKTFIATYGTTTAAEVASAISAGKIVACYYEHTTNDKHWLYLVDETDSKYVFTEASVATDGNSTAISGLGAALNKITNAWEMNTGGASIPTFPATIVNDRYLHTNETTGELEWSEVSGADENAVHYTTDSGKTDAQKLQARTNIGALGKDNGIYIVSLTDANETLAEIVARLATINAAGEHVFFDVATLSYPLYLCTISIIYNGSTPTVYRLNDLVSGSVSMGSYDGTKTLGAILSEAVADYVTLTVTCTTQDGVTVTGQTVTIRQGDSASSPVWKTVAYNGQPVSVVVPQNFTYFCSVSDTLSGHFNPTTAQGIASTNTSVVLTYNDVSHVSTYSDIARAVAAGARDVLVGTEISDTWIDENGTSYDDPSVCVSVEQVEDEDGETHWAAIMERKWAIKNTIMFDNAETELATGTYEADIYYYVSDSSAASTFKLLVAGTDYNVGDTITGTVYKNSLNDNTGYICRYGYNNYKLSAYRQYLNSEDAIGAWWTSQHLGDTAPSQLNSVRGYLAGCSTAMKNAAKTIKIQCYANTVTDGGRIDTMYDKVWLPSGTQMYGNVNANEGTYFKYWKDATGLSAPDNAANAGRIHYNVTNHSSASTCRLRSAYRSNSYYVWYCNTSGTLGNSSAGNSFSSAPAFAIF